MSDACRKKMTENAPKSKQKWKSVDLFSFHDFNYPIVRHCQKVYISIRSN